jgi:hypothetical protein
MRRMNLDTPNLLDDFTGEHAEVLSIANLQNVRDKLEPQRHKEHEEQRSFVRAQIMLL